MYGGSGPEAFLPGPACTSAGDDESWHRPWQGYLGHLSVRLRFLLKCCGMWQIKNSVVNNQMSCSLSTFLFPDTHLHGNCQRKSLFPSNWTEVLLDLSSSPQSNNEGMEFLKLKGRIISSTHKVILMPKSMFPFSLSFPPSLPSSLFCFYVFPRLYLCV